MFKLMRSLYASYPRAARRKMNVATFGLLGIALFDIIGLGLILPLTELLTNGRVTTGITGDFWRLLGKPDKSTFAVELAVVIFAMFLCKGLFTLTVRWWVLGFTNHHAAERATDLFIRYMYGPYGFHVQRNTAELLRTLNTSVNQAYLTVVNGVMQIITEAATILAVGAVLLVLRPGTAVAALAYFSVVGYGFHRASRTRARTAGEELNETSRTQFKASLQGLGGIKEISVRGTQPYFVAGYRAARGRQATAQRMALFLGEAPRYVFEMVLIFGIALMCVVIFSGGDPSSGTATLALFLAAGFRMMPSAVRLMASNTQLRVAINGIEIVLADVGVLPAVEPRTRIVEPLPIEEKVTIRSLEFRYPNAEEPALCDVDVELEAGASLAVVGSSGAGKTTLVDLLLGLYQPSGGTIEVDGRPIDADIEAWQRGIGLVPQDVYLLDDSVRANIAFGEPTDEIDEDRVLSASGRAQLDTLIADLPDGLDTFIGERGVRLSGGQRQRIGIARALYREPHLLILDEATSSLDNETERRITSTIESLHGELTMIVIAHRLSTVRHCDKLIFMSRGRIESFGSFEEVRDANREFAHLVELGSLESLERAG